MSATVLYTPMSVRREVKGSGASVWATTKEIFGDSPTLEERHLPMLKALTIAATFDKEYWSCLVKLVEKHGAIALDAEY